jgi:hypothetical protein
MIFENKDRNYLGYHDYFESDFEFYDRTSNPEFSVVRQMINDWAEWYPVKDLVSIKQRIKSEYTAVFYELFMFTIFRKMGFSLEPHPNLNETNTRPDFFATKNDLEFFIEAKVTSEYNKSNKIENSIYQSLMKIKNSGFMLLIDSIDLINGKQPPLKKIRQTFEKELNKLDPDNLGSDFARYPKLKYSDQCIEIEITPCPRKPENRKSKEFVSIGSFPIQTRWGGSTNTFKKAILKKSGKYKDLGKPLIIALNFISPWGFYENEIIDALFGSYKATFNRLTNEVYPFRLNDSVFNGPNGPQCTRISGVIITSVNPFNLHHTNILLYHNPYARYPIKLDSLGLPQKFVSNEGILTFKDGLSIDDILNKQNIT